MDLKTMWAGLSRPARWGLGAGVAVILIATLALAQWALHIDYDVLFARLSPQDAAAMTRELDQMKVPYRLGDDGATILVDKAAVPATRLKLMGKDLPLHGTVGFELFNNSDFGMTEFAQKVNYQRALQGELTRTILSLAEVETARVHLAFPDDGLFKRDQARTKASITLTLRDGRALRREQVRGIQRLVAAAVPGIENRDVTLVDAQGVALTPDNDDDTGRASASSRMDVKREIEQYLTQKANTVLDKAFGPGQAMASVDVTLDMNQLRVTTEDVITPPAAPGEGAVGVVLRERETTRDSNAKGNPTAGEGAAPASTQREVDYQLGRRVEQLVSSPGTVTRLQALAVLRSPLNPAQVDQVKLLLASAVGATKDRGDVVVVQTLDALSSGATSAATSPVPAIADSAVNSRPEPTARPRNAADESAGPATRGALPVPWAVGALLVLALIGLVGLLSRRRRGEPPALTAAEREARLAQLRAWLVQAETTNPLHGDHR